MGELRFDGFAMRLGTSIARRGALGVLAALGASGAAGILGANAKGKGKGKSKGKNKHKSGSKRNCPAKAKPACAASACQASVCDYRRRKWSCRNACAGTSTPKCLGGQCVDACDESLGLFECGDNCCNPLVHSECCQGTCCEMGQRCKNGQCVKSCEAWSDVTGGRLEYAITYELRGNLNAGWTQIDQSANAVADLTCSYNAVWGDMFCESVAGTISGSHHMTYQADDCTEEQEASGSEDLGELFPALEIYLPESDENPTTYEVHFVTIGVEGTWEDCALGSITETFYIPGGFDGSLWTPDLQPLPPTPQPLSGTFEWSDPQIEVSNIARFTWTFTPDGC